MSNLILITSEYPFLSGEPFLLNELPYLSDCFDEIYIFSTNGSATDMRTREIPSNAKCFPLGNTTSKSKYLRYMVAGIKKPDRDLQINVKSPMGVAASLYSRGRASEIVKRIICIINEFKLQVNGATIYSFWFAYQAIAAWLLSKELNKNGNNTICVSRAHGYDLYWERAAGGYLPFQDASLRNLDWCFPCSEYGTQYLLEKYPWAVNKIQTKRLGTMDYGLNPYMGEKTLVTCCNLEPIKRMCLFAESFCEVAKKDTMVKWICIGSGNDEALIKTIIENAGVSEQVEFTGHLSNEKVIDIYKKVGVMYLCNVSLTEGLPVSIMEAMSFGIPIIATDVGGTSELVDSENGGLLPSNIDAKKLSKYLTEFISLSYDSYKKLRKVSRNKWKEKVSADVNYKLFCDVIKSSE